MPIDVVGHKLAQYLEDKLGFSLSHGMSDRGYHIYIPSLEVEILVKDSNLLSLDSLTDDSEPLEVEFENIEDILLLIVDWIEDID